VVARYFPERRAITVTPLDHQQIKFSKIRNVHPDLVVSNTTNNTRYI
jgi:hypothetical protein